MEAVRAGAKSCCFVPVEVEEFGKTDKTSRKGGLGSTGK